MHFIDTHAHLDGEEYKNDLSDVVDRAKQAGAQKIFIPAIDLKSVTAIINLCRSYPDFAFPMIGLHQKTPFQKVVLITKFAHIRMVTIIIKDAGKDVKPIAVNFVGFFTR